ncbi:DUF2914 domain-containing protein [Halomonas sp. DP5Y7-2]|uniref:DUF5924 family protein n=1 Tax=Halomonas sp. DP5Y7-2 TaxID=2859076 RepID=UPI001C99FD21|nr:DUF5924 family protein [Halomonas sp. DP5Y7-2]MBY5985999.1 DUF2914 domain-containing protein [Halomonas sp. DP5Y7-2]
MSTPPAQRTTLNALQRTIETWVARLRPWHWVWPPLAFAAGVASFFLVERQQWLGVLLATGMLLAWILLLSESLIGRIMVRRGYPSLPRGVTTFIAQMIHQETLFFTLPFLVATTVWTSGQALFTLFMLAMAILSIVDPLYYRLAARKRWLYFVFHAQCVFLVVLVTLPLVLHLSTGQSMLAAVVAMLLFSLPSLLHLLRPLSPSRWLAMFALLPVLAGAAWLGRVWVPPATLWLSGSALSPAFDEASRTPQGNMALTPEALTSRGLYAYTAIHAPRGLKEEVVHEWRHEGQLVDRIALEIYGGRAEGYRAWTRKQNFPDNVTGSWRIDVMTAGGQRIGVLRFEVADDPDQATRADATIDTQVGMPGLRLRWLTAGPEGQEADREEEKEDAGTAPGLTEDHSGRSESSESSESSEDSENTATSAPAPSEAVPQSTAQ